MVKWKDKAVEEATWGDELNMRSQFPELSLVDKTVLQGGGIDMSPSQNRLLEPLSHERKKGGNKEWLVYSRKKRGAKLA